MLPPFNQVDHVPCLAGGCSTYVEGLVGGCTPNVGARLDEATSEAASSATRAASTGWLESGWLEPCFDQEVPKVLWSSLSSALTPTCSHSLSLLFHLFDYFSVTPNACLVFLFTSLYCCMHDDVVISVESTSQISHDNTYLTKPHLNQMNPWNQRS